MSNTGKTKKTQLNSIDNKVFKPKFTGTLPSLENTVWFFKDGVKVGVRADRVAMKTQQWDSQQVKYHRIP